MPSGRNPKDDVCSDERLAWMWMLIRGMVLADQGEDAVGSGGTMCLSEWEKINLMFFVCMAASFLMSHGAFANTRSIRTAANMT